MSIRQQLMEAIESLDVVDAHEQLAPEIDQLREPVDVFTLFSDLAGSMLVSSGMSEQAARSLADHALPIETRWATFEPFYKAARDSGPVRIVRRALAGLFETPELTARTCAAASERIAAAYRPGLYRRILQDACQIETCLNVADEPADQPAGTRTILPIGQISAFADLADFRARMERLDQPADLTEYAEGCRKWLARQQAAGAVALNAVVEPITEPDQAAAEALFRRLKNGEGELRISQLRPLRHYLMHEAFEIAGELGMVVVLGCGTGGFLWEDFTRRSPQHALGLMADHRATRFDLLCGGLPWTRSSGVLAARFPNVSVNLSITPVISERLAAAALDEWLDLVPACKIIAFGGHHRRPVPNIYGHLMAARSVIAEALAARVARGDMNLVDAVEAAGILLDANARAIYRV
jgi:hypothetical protein